MSGHAHIPVLRKQCLQAFDGAEISIFFDGTLGAGGHAQSLLMAHPEIERYIGCDRDESALALATENLAAWQGKLETVHGNFADIDVHLEACGVKAIDGCLLDLGVSSMQLDQEERGFSFSKDGPLDMRMDQNERLTAKEIVNTWSKQQLAKIFSDYGEIKNAQRIAEALCDARRKKPFETTKQLADWASTVMGHSRKKLHPATLLFQALRIAVNLELESVWQGVVKALNLLRPGGRLAVIAFHSLEDRIVKNLFRQAARPNYDWNEEKVEGLPEVKLLTKKPLVADFDEVRLNPRARSAKLRVVEKIG
ncbi:MAG: 16S rRNA (cytosine(1402)-N(4))-methyltransferase RsmH [Chlamydiia bacterium]|nr:16S rRNA (cytosine(1402)-N(4))-methyltransferase RsmH [Chlamydiia bacterium]